MIHVAFTSSYNILHANCLTCYFVLSKIELHLHADGACRIETLRELAREYDVQENGKPLPYDDLEKFKACVGLPLGASSLADFLKVFNTLDKILRCVFVHLSHKMIIKS